MNDNNCCIFIVFRIADFIRFSINCIFQSCLFSSLLFCYLCCNVLKPLYLLPYLLCNINNITIMVINDYIHICEILNLLWKSFVLDVGRLFVPKDQCFDELMHTLVHRNVSLTFWVHHIHHSLSCCWEKRLRLCETKKTKTVDDHSH